MNEANEGPLCFVLLLPNLLGNIFMFSSFIFSSLYFKQSMNELTLAMQVLLWFQYQNKTFLDNCGNKLTQEPVEWWLPDKGFLHGIFLRAVAMLNNIMYNLSSYLHKSM